MILVYSPIQLIGDVGVSSLTKGETKKVQHTITWNQYKEDDLTVKVKASDPSIIGRPDELTLNFEKHQFRFDYEVKAGTGRREITPSPLTPAAGKPVVVQVLVK